MEPRVVIEQAKGALMAGYGVSPDNAFKILAFVSLVANLNVDQVAERLLNCLSSWEAGPLGPDVLDTCLWRAAD